MDEAGLMIWLVWRWGKCSQHQATVQAKTKVARVLQARTPEDRPACRVGAAPG